MTYEHELACGVCGAVVMCEHAAVTLVNHVRTGRTRARQRVGTRRAPFAIGVPREWSEKNFR